MPRYTMQVDLTNETQAVIDGIHERMGIPKRQIVHRVFDWFAKQDEEMQMLVMGMFSDDGQKKAARRLLQEIIEADDLPPPSKHTGRRSA